MENVSSVKKQWLLVKVIFTNEKSGKSFDQYFFSNTYLEGIKAVFRAMKRQGMKKDWKACFSVVAKTFDK